MARARIGIVALLALLVTPALPAQRVEARKKKPIEPSAAATRMLDDQGFAVEDGCGSRLSTPYRWPTGPVFVTADSGLAAYFLCLRDLRIHRAGHAAEAIGPLLAAWTEALGRSAAGPEREAGRLFVALLRRVQGNLEADAGLTAAQRAALDAELTRLEAGDPAARVPGLGTPLHRGPVASLWTHGWLGGPERWQVVTFLLTRGRCDRPLRDRLQDTMPRRIEHLVRRSVAGVGSVRLDYPGRGGVFDVALHEGARFPPGVLQDHADMVGLDLGVRVGIPWAAEVLGRRALAAPIHPVAADPPEDTLRARFLHVLRELPGKPDSAPAMFASEAWQRLELQTALGAQVLFRKAVGVASTASKVFAAPEGPGFVHPDPAFWTALAALALQTARDARHDGVRNSIPTEAELLALEAIVRRRLDEETPFTERELAILGRCWKGLGNDFYVPAWGTERYHEKTSPELRERWRREVEDDLLGARHGLPALRARRGELSTPGSVRWLERLAEVCEQLALYARRQLGGELPEDPAEILAAYGFLLEDVDGRFRDDPTTTCVRALIDGDRALFQGVAGMDRFWVRYPWGEGLVLCRGSVFAYRELVSAFFVHEGDWRRRVRGSSPPPRPAWTSAFVAR